MAGRDLDLPRLIQLRELVLGFEGLALLRGLVDSSDADQAARIAEIVKIAGEIDDEPWSLGLEVPELDPRSGYAQWAQSYDAQDNLLIDAEQQPVEEICATVAGGRALDAACGTGRHAKHLADRFEVTGIDQSPEMLERARAEVPAATFHEGSFDALPFEDGSFDLVVCSLALTHVTDLKPPIAEFARVCAHGGRVVISDMHPMAVLVLGQGFFMNPDGSMAFVRNHVHLLGAYFAAFEAAGLRVARCVEPLTDAQRYGGPASPFVPEAVRAAIRGLPLAVVWELERV